MSKNKVKYCPVCNRELSEINKSNAKFNDDCICIYCIKVINKHRGGEISSDNIYLEDLQKIVKDDKRNTIIAVFVVAIIFLIILMFIISLFNGEEYKCQTKEECEEERYRQIWLNSEN